VQCASVADVQNAIEFAQTKSVPLAARSGGHSYAGYSTPNQGLVVDVRAMNSVTVNADGTAVVGAGARLFDVYSAVAAAGRCIPAGSCPTVGVAGVTMGGGIGVLARQYGLTCDQLLSADLVLADGTTVTASATSHPDLYWAIRGGGGGNFGIVTSFTFTTYAAPAAMMCWSLTFPAGSATAVIGAWQEWIPEQPNELWSTMVISSGKPCGARVGGSFLGSADALSTILNGFIAKVGKTPTAQSALSKSYLDAMRYYGGCSTKTTAQCHIVGETSAGVLQREAFVASSRMLDAAMPDPSKVPLLLNNYVGVDLLFDSLGGAVANVAPDASAFPHRSSIASVQIYKGTTTAGQAGATSDVSAIQAALAGITGTGAYVNYIDPTMKDWATACYGDNLPRLKQVASAYDPDGFFGFAQSIDKA
jgi:hypothetical protein